MASVTVSASAANQLPTVRLDTSYLKTLPAIVKIAEALCGLIGFICIQSMYYARYLSAGGFYNFVAMTGFWVALLLLLSYMFHIVEKLHRLPWLMFEAGFALMWTVFFFIAACVAASNGWLDAGWSAAAFFAFLATAIYGYEAFVKYKSWKSGSIAQGEQPRVANEGSLSPSDQNYPKY